MNSYDSSLSRSTTEREYIVAPNCFRRCRACRGQAQTETTAMCQVSQDHLPKTSFYHSVWHNRTDKGRRVVCMDCRLPPRTNAECDTCRSCRAVQCKTPSCREPPIEVHRNRWLKEKLDKVTFTCEDCALPCGCCKKRCGPKTVQSMARHKKARGIIGYVRHAILKDAR